MLTAGGAILCGAYLIRSFFAKSPIPQSEIDAEARRLIVEHGADAEEMAHGHWVRSQWSKGKGRKIERAERVLKAVQRHSRQIG